LDTLFDSNVWLALTFSAHPHHSLAKKFFATTTREKPACFCRATQQSFLRLATTPALLRAYGAEGFTNLDAVSLIAALTQLPNIRMLPEPLELEPLWHRLAGLPTASPKVWMDAYLASFAIRHEAEFVTLDRDFQNFEKDGLKLNLLTS
jgi:toxin-antitoxin system PIN domain toxin